MIKTLKHLRFMLVMLLATLGVNVAFGAEAETITFPTSAPSGLDVKKVLSIDGPTNGTLLDNNSVYLFTSNSGFTFNAIYGIESTKLAIVFKPTTDCTLSIKAGTTSNSERIIQGTYYKASDKLYDLFANAGSLTVYDYVLGICSNDTERNWWKNNSVIKYSSSKWIADESNGKKTISGETVKEDFRTLLFAANCTIPAGNQNKTATFTIQKDSKDYVFKAGIAYAIYAYRNSSGVGFCDLTFTPVADPYTVTFDPNGGNCGTSSLEETAAGAGVTLPSATPADEATQEFRGWAVSSTETDPTKIFAAGTKYEPADDVTLYAIYGPKTTKSSIVYANTKGASTAALPILYTEGVGIAEFAALGDVDGWHFTGWNPASISASATGEQTITAEWEAVVTPYFVMNYSKPSDSKVESIVCTNGSVADANATAKALSLEANDIKFGGNDCRLLVTLADATIVEGTKIEISWKSLYSDGTTTGIAILNGENTSKTMDITGIGGASTDADTEYHIFSAADAANYSDQFIITRNGTGKSLGVTAIKVYNVGPAAVKHTVRFFDGTTQIGEDVLVTDGGTVARPADPIKVGYHVAGWKKDGADYDFANSVTSDIDLVVDWTVAYAKSVDFEAAAAGSDAYTKVLGDNNYWYGGDGKSWDNNAGNNDAFVGLKMKAANSTIEFLAQAGKMLVLKVGVLDAGKNEMYQNGNKVAAGMTGGSTATGEKNFNLHYFYSDADALYKFQTTDANTQVIKAISFVDPYTVTFTVPTGAEAVAPMTFKAVALTLPEATGEGVFLGWYDAAEGGNQIGEAGKAYTPAGDVELFAQFAAQDPDATLKTLKYDETTIELAADKFVYNVVLPYGAAVPTVSGVANSDAAQSVEVFQATADNTYYATVRVKAEAGNTQDYQVRFTWAAKLGVEIIKATITGNSSATASGLYAGEVATLNSSKKLGTNGHYVKFVLESGKTFATGDMLALDVVLVNGASKVYVTSDAPDKDHAANATILCTIDHTFAEGMNYIVLPEAINGLSEFYIYRVDSKFNPTINSAAVQRYMAPVITSFKIGEAEGVIDQEHKTIAVKVAHDADLAALTAPVVEAIGNGGAVVVTPANQTDFSAPVVFTATDAYGELNTEYTVTVTKAEAPAAEPVITVQPASHNYADTETIAALTVEATVSDAGTLSYQWYKGEELVGENLPTYTPTEAGSYKVVVTNTLGEETAEVTSEVAVITVRHIYTFGAWTEGATFTKAGEWTIYPYNKDNRWVTEDVKFTANQTISAADANVKANIFNDQYFVMKFEKEVKNLVMANYYSGSDRYINGLYTVVLGNAAENKKGSTAEITSDYEITYAGRSTNDAKVTTTTINGHFEAGVYYVFKMNGTNNAIFDIFATESEVVTPAVSTITAVEIGGEALDATELAAFVADKGATLAKTDAAFAVKVTETVKDIYDDGFKKLVATNEYNQTAALDATEENFVATLTINGEVYTVSAPKMGDPVAKIGTAAYETLAEAVAAANAGDEIIMLADVDLTAQIEIADKAIALDLAGHTINYTGAALGSGVLLVHNGAGLTINDSSDPDAGAIVANAAYAAVALTKKNDDAANAAVLVVNGGTLTGKYYAVVGNGSRPNTEITINGGMLTAVEPGDNIGIYHPQCGTLTITGGTIEAETGIAIKAGVLTINGGTIHATGANGTPTEAFGNGVNVSGAAIQIESNDGYGVACNKEVELHITAGEITSDNAPAIYEYVANAATETHMTNSNISGGTINGAQPVYVSAGVEGFIAGGTFNQAVPAAACAVGFEPKDNGNGTYGVKVQENILDIEGDMIFNFVGAVDEQVNGVNNGTYEVLAGYTGIKAQANGLYVAADFNKITTGNLQGKGLKFHTTVPCFITVEFSNTGSKTNYRELYINGVATGAKSKTTGHVTYTQFVEAGDVVLTAFEETASWNMLNYYKVTFSAIDETVRTGLTAGKIVTYCNSKNVVAHDGATFYYVSNKASDLSSIELTEVTGELKAGYPYIVIAEKSEIRVVYGTDEVATAKDYNGLYGVLGDPVDLVDGDYGIVNNKYYRAHTGNGNYCPDGRAYLRLDEIEETTVAPGEETQNPAARRVRMGTSDTTVATGIDAIEMTEDVQKILMDGVVYIIRGGKLYNVAGQIVK